MNTKTLSPKMKTVRRWTPESGQCIDRAFAVAAVVEQVMHGWTVGQVAATAKGGVCSGDLDDIVNAILDNNLNWLTTSECAEALHAETLEVV